MDPEIVEQPNEPVVELPSTAAPIETPPSEPLDERGVPYKNRVAELERKLNETQTVNQQYQQVLGQYLQNQPAQPRPAAAAPADDPEEAQLDPVSRKIVYSIARKIAREEAQGIAERTGYKFVTQAEHQNSISNDPEMYEEAKRQYATFKQHPMWAGVDDTLVQDRAIAGAKAVVAEKRRTTATATATQSANRTQASVASVPGTQPSTPAAPSGDKQKWVSQYVVQPETLKMFKMFEGHSYDQSNEQDRKKMSETAEEAYRGTKFTGSTARAFQAFKSGAAQDMLGNMEEV